MRPLLPRSSRPLIFLLALGLAAGCASASGNGATENGPAPSGEADASARADEGPTCQGDCWLKVENRLRNDAEVSVEYQPAIGNLGVVHGNETEVFHLEDFTGEHIEIWVRDTESRDLIGLDCIRQFRRVQGRRQGHMVLGEGGPAGTSGC